ncbi:MAG: DNA repair exonuclease [Clostridia bacterium]|nr:DNA repair exonuclease [Clostridia bacterium]
MKFVHIADMHFDTPFTTLNTKGDFGKIRRLDQRKVFEKIIKHVKENKIPYLFIAGDFYEHNTIRKSTIEYINEQFKTIPETNIYISPGNHDPYVKGSMYYDFSWNENVKIFTSKIEKVETKEATIYGYGFSDFYCSTLEIENIKIENKDKINILITHADLNASGKTNISYNPISKSKLKELEFDYIALGHIHKQEIQEEIVYPGSTIAMGFDELGKHGFIEGNLEKGNLKLNFIPVDNKEFKELELDVTNINDNEQLIQIINNISLKENCFYKIILIGKRNFEIDILNLSKLIENPNILKIKNKTKINYSLEEMQNEYTLKGIFVKQIIEQMQNENYTEEQLEKILEIGLSVLDK